MARGGLPALAGLDVADDPGVWRALGFDVGPGGEVQIGAVVLQLRGTAPGSALTGWTMRAAGPLPPAIDGIPTAVADARAPGPAPRHPNGATRLDHVVVRTPDLDRTIAAFEATGIELARIRDAGPDLRQAFLWAGDVVLEVVGSSAASGDGPAALWGLVVVAPDLDVVAALPAAPLGSVRPAVQEGRSIATVRREFGSSVPLAFMTPHRPRPTEESR